MFCSLDGWVGESAVSLRTFRQSRAPSKGCLRKPGLSQKARVFGSSGDLVGIGQLPTGAILTNQAILMRQDAQAPSPTRAIVDHVPMLCALRARGAELQ